MSLAGSIHIGVAGDDQPDAAARQRLVDGALFGRRRSGDGVGHALGGGRAHQVVTQVQAAEDDGFKEMGHCSPCDDVLMMAVL